MNNDFNPVRKFSLPAAFSLVFALTGCGGSNSGGENLQPASFKNAGVVASVASSGGSGSISLYSLDSDEYSAVHRYHQIDTTDFKVSGEQGLFYIIGRYQKDNISKVETSNIAQKSWTYTTNDTDPNSASSNPHKIIQINDNKAYILRYGSKDVWVVDLSAQSQSAFLVKTIDLSRFSHDGNSVPHMYDAALVEGKLFVTLQRMNGWSVEKSGYLAVIDTATDALFDTDENTAEIEGIGLQTFNPHEIGHIEGVGLVVASAGAYGSSTYQGGIELVNPNNYVSQSIITQQTADTGNITKLAIVNENLGYFTGYQKPVFSFDPTPSVTPSENYSVLQGFEAGEFRDIAISPKGNLWVADADLTNPGIRIINPTDGSLVQFAESYSGQLPSDIAFTTEK